MKQRIFFKQNALTELFCFVFLMLFPADVCSQQTAEVESWYLEDSDRIRSVFEQRIKQKPEFATDVQFSKPDYIVYIPTVEQGRVGDTYNDHFQVFDKPNGKLFALWCQATVEGALDMHVSFSRSFDKGKTWEPPRVLAGNRTIAEGFANGGAIAGWAFPLVSKSGRIYILYQQFVPGKVSTNRQYTGIMMGMYSDNDGDTWTKPEEIAIPRSIYDAPSADIPPEWIVWQKPVRLGKNGNYIVGVSRWAHSSFHATKFKTATQFIHFDNLDKNPPIKDIIVRWVHMNDQALRMGAFCDEPTIVQLPDSRLFCVMRTGTGSCWTQSRDGGETWSEPKPLLTKDEGKMFIHPLSPCPIYDTKGNEAASGLYFLLAYNIFDHTARHLTQKRPFSFFAGRFQKDAKQPVWFDEPKEFINRPAFNSFFTSLTILDGKTILWYPDQKFYLLGREINNDFSSKK